MENFKKAKQKQKRQLTVLEQTILSLENKEEFIMRITKYKTELDTNNHNILVKESACNYPAEDIRTPDKITEMLNAVFRLNRQAEEYMYMLALDNKCKLLGVFEVAHGTVNATICNPREIFIRALLCGASCIVLIHNHPSGDATPSKEDMHVFQKTKDAAEIIGINLLDNIIVGEKYFSFMKAGLM